MTNRFVGVLLDAVKVAVAAWVAFRVEPWVGTILPTAPEPLQFLLAAVIAAVVLEGFLQIFFGWPRIDIEWATKDEDAPVSQILARIRSSTSESQPFILKVSVPTSGFIGYQVLRRAMRGNVRLQIRIDRALIVPTCESSSRSPDTHVPTVVADAESNGFVVDLGRVLSRPGLWHHATVRWHDESTPPGEDFNIDYVFDHDNASKKFLLNHLIWRANNAKQFRVVGN